MNEPRTSDRGKERYRLELRKVPIGWTGRKVLIGDSYGGLDLEDLHSSWRPTTRGLVRVLRRQADRERRIELGPDEVIHDV